MPNLTLTHSGNMNITNAYIAGNSLKVDYNKNNTGAVIGFTFTPEEGTEFVCGETYTITAVPQFSGTVLTENFLVSGVDIAGVRRTDTSTLRQGYDSNLEHYTFDLAAVGATIISSSITSTYAQVEIRIDNTDYAEIDFQTQGGAVITYPIDNISGDEPGPGPDTGVVATSITLVVDEEIVASGDTSVLYEPSDADVEISYSISDSSIATIDGEGHIEVLQDGEVVICAIEERSGLMDCKTVDVYLENPDTGDTGDTGTVINYLELIVDDEIVENGVAVPVYSPATADTLFVFTSSDPGIATIDSGGNITVLDNGEVTFCVRDEISGLEDCKTVIVRKAVYIESIQIIVSDSLFASGVATASYTPTGATVDLIYSSSDPEIASIDARTGAITAYGYGDVVFTVRDLYTNLSNSKMVRIVAPPRVCITYNTNHPNLGGGTTGSTFLFSANPYFYTKAEYNGVDITNDIALFPGGSYRFPEDGYQTICYTLNVTKSNGVYSCGIPHFAFTTNAFGSNVAAINFEAADPLVNAYIGTLAFTGATEITEVIIPDGWSLSYDTSLEHQVNSGSQFAGCYNIRKVSLGNSVTGVGYGTFANTHLTSLTMTDNLVCLGPYAFFNSTSLTGVTLSNNLEYIGLSCFSNCTSLKEIRIPNTLQFVGEEAFYQCTSLKDVYFRDYSVLLGVRMFAGCTSLTGVTVGDGVVNTFTDKFTYINIGTTAFNNCFSGTTGMTFDIEEPSPDVSVLAGNGSFPIYIPCDSYLAYKEYEYSDSITSRLMPIGGEWCGPTAYTIEMVYRVTSTTQPVTLATRHNAAKVYLEDGTEITTSTYTFPETGDTVVYYQASNTSFMANLNYSIIDIRIPEGIKEIGGIWGKSSITTLSIPDSVTALTVNLYARDLILSGSTMLETIVFGKGVADFTITGMCSGCTALNSIIFPSGITIGTNVFADCTALEYISLPTIQGLGVGTFKGCTSLTGISMPNLVGIDSQCFARCTALTSITLPSSVSYMGAGCFSGCTALTSIYCYATTAPATTKDGGYDTTFQGIPNNGILYYPATSSGYYNWLSNYRYYLGFYNWTGSNTL